MGGAILVLGRGGLGRALTECPVPAPRATGRWRRGRCDANSLSVRESQSSLRGTPWRQGRPVGRRGRGAAHVAYLVELPLGGANGQPAGAVRVAIEEQPGDGLVQVARPGQVVARATRSLGELLSGVRPVAENFVETFRGMAHGPDEISIEFGLSLSAAADVVISSTSAQANFAVRLTWDRRTSDDEPSDAPSNTSAGRGADSSPSGPSGYVTVPPPLTPGATA